MQVCSIRKNNDNYDVLAHYYGISTDTNILHFNNPDLNLNISKQKKEFLNEHFYDYAKNNFIGEGDIEYPVIFTNDQGAVDKLNQSYNKDNNDELSPYYIEDEILKYKYDIDFNYIPKKDLMEKFLRVLPMTLRLTDDQLIHNHLNRIVDRFANKYGVVKGSMGSIRFEGSAAVKRAKSFQHAIKKNGVSSLVEKISNTNFKVVKDPQLYEAYRDMIKVRYTDKYGINHMIDHKMQYKEDYEYLEEGREAHLLMFNKDTHNEADNVNKWITNLMTRKAKRAGLTINTDAQTLDQLHQTLYQRYGVKFKGSGYTDMMLGAIYIANNDTSWESLTEETLHYVIALSWQGIKTGLLNNDAFKNHPEYQDRYIPYKQHYREMAKIYREQGNTDLADSIDKNASDLALQEVVAKIIRESIKREISVWGRLNITNPVAYKAVTKARDLWTWVKQVLDHIKSKLRLVSSTNQEYLEFNNMLRKWARAVLSDKEFRDFTLKWGDTGIKDLGNDIIPPFNTLHFTNADFKYVRTETINTNLFDNIAEHELTLSLSHMKGYVTKLLEQKYSIPDYKNKNLLDAFITLYKDQEAETINRDPVLEKFFPFSPNTIMSLVSDVKTWLAANPNALVGDLLEYMVQSRFNKTDLQTIYDSNPALKAQIPILKNTMINSLDAGIRVQSPQGNYTNLTQEQLIEYMDGFIDWVVSYKKNENVVSTIKRINQSISATKKHLRENDEFSALVRFFSGVPVERNLSKLSIIHDILGANLASKHYSYIYRRMADIEQVLTAANNKINSDYVYDTIYTEFTNLINSVNPNISPDQLLALRNTVDLFDKLNKDLANNTYPVTERLTEPGSFDYVYTTYSGGLVNQMEDVLYYVEDRKISADKYDVDKVDIEDYAYVHYMRTLLKDIKGSLEGFISRIESQVVTKNLSELESNYSKAEYDFLNTNLDPILDYDQYEDLKDIYQAAKYELDVYNKVQAIKERLSGSPKTGNRRSIQQIQDSLNIFLNKVHDPLLLRYVSTRTTNPYITSETDPIGKLKKAKDLIERELHDSNVIENLFYATGDNAAPMLLQVMRIDLQREKESLNKLSTAENETFNRLTRAIEEDLRNNEKIRDYIVKRKATYVGAILAEYNDNNVKTGNFITEYRLDEYNKDKDQIDEAVLVLAENIIKTGNVQDDNVLELDIPEHLKRKDHFGRAYNTMHEIDRHMLTQEGIYDDIKVYYNFKTPEWIPLSAYLRIRRNDWLSDINDQPNGAQLSEINKTIKQMRLTLSPIQYEEWYSKNVYRSGSKIYYLGQLAIPAKKYLNKDFIELNSIPEFREYYALATEFHKNANIKIGGAEVSTWTLLPQKQRSSIEIYNIAAKVGLRIGSQRFLSKFADKFKHIYYRYRALLNQDDIHYHRDLVDTAGSDKIPYRKVHTRYRQPIEVQELTDDIIDSLQVYNTMANNVHYGMKALAKFDGLSRIIRDMPWVINMGPKSNFRRLVSKPLKNTVARLYGEIPNALKVKSPIDLDTPIKPNEERFGDKPEVRSINTVIPNHAAAYERALEVVFNGPISGATLVGPKLNKLLTGSITSVGKNILQWRVFTIVGSFIAAYGNIFTNYNTILVSKDKHYLNTLKLYSTRVIKDHFNLLHTYFMDSTAWLVNLPASFGGGLNVVRPMTKLSYLTQIARAMETGELQSLRRNALIGGLHYAAGWGAWQTTGAAQKLLALNYAFNNYRYSAHFGEWLTYSQYGSLINHTINKKIKNYKYTLKHPDGIQDPDFLNAEIIKLQGIKQNIPSYSKLRSLYDVIEFIPFYKKGAEQQIEKMDVTFTSKIAKQMIGDGSTIDVDYKKVTSHKDLDAAFNQAMNLEKSADGKEKYPNQSAGSENIIYKIWMQMKKWVLQNVSQSFTRSHWNEETAQWQSGYWPAIIRGAGTILGWGSLVKEFSADKNTGLNKGDAEAAMRAASVSAQILVLVYLSEALNQAWCDDQTKRSSFWCTIMRICLFRAGLESTSYFMVPWFRDEFLTMFTRPPVFLDNASNSRQIGVAVSGYNYALGEGTGPSKNKYFKPHGENQYAFGGDLLKHAYTEREVKALTSLFPFGGLIPAMSTRNALIYEDGLLKYQQPFKELAKKVYNYPKAYLSEKEEVKKGNTLK